MVLINDFNGIFEFGIVLGIVFVLIMVALGIFVFVFWILMLIDCLKRRYKESSDKIVWVIVIVFTQILGALIYYFVVKVKDKKK
ncbi:MAG TPA: PLDc N-terminal domain-containing protein [Candidatus Pacearchaeota archaeon]|nr:PLDc N-terminal domain-containing protein [Candidatus Pacearchaeota archaeon]